MIFNKMTQTTMATLGSLYQTILHNIRNTHGTTLAEDTNRYLDSICFSDTRFVPPGQKVLPYTRAGANFVKAVKAWKNSTEVRS